MTVAELKHTMTLGKPHTNITHPIALSVFEHCNLCLACGRIANAAKDPLWVSVCERAHVRVFACVSVSVGGSANTEGSHEYTCKHTTCSLKSV
jgi:hypothetical protein